MARGKQEKGKKNRERERETVCASVTPRLAPHQGSNEEQDKEKLRGTSSKDDSRAHNQLRGS